MSGHARAIDIATSPELQRLAEQVEQTRMPVELRRDDEVLAVVRPAPARRPKRAPKQSASEAFASSFGGLKGLVDSKTFKEIYESRGSHRPTVNL